MSTTISETDLARALFEYDAESDRENNKGNPFYVSRTWHAASTTEQKVYVKFAERCMLAFTAYTDLLDITMYLVAADKRKGLSWNNMTPAEKRLWIDVVATAYEFVKGE